ncbi:hypothetical protein [Brevibacillus sp. BC25]|uniref:hypothetical protein n=1 Tax=Brevibacillus sp. BC25 TaxID=1144308 RepID=UPI000271036C|nr:hypothetical protein [Brevibacillus sp. BC25]EJL31404.1 hypothetical protein PMI05_00767 [Brevibacillus sp. BC25]
MKELKLIYKYLPHIWTVILFVALILTYFKGSTQIFPTVLLAIFMAPIVYFIKPQEIAKNCNILFMTFVTFLFFPLSISFWITAFLLSETGYDLYIIVLGIAIVSSLIFAIKIKFDRNQIFLENAKISFDIIRLIFVVFLSLSVIFTNFISDFSMLYKIVRIDSNNLEDTRKMVIVLLQLVSFPYILTSTGLKIIADCLLLLKKRKKELIEQAKKNTA